MDETSLFNRRGDALFSSRFLQALADFDGAVVLRRDFHRGRHAHPRRDVELPVDAHGLARRGITRRALRSNGDVEVQGCVADFAAGNGRG